MPTWCVACLFLSSSFHAHKIISLPFKKAKKLPKETLASNIRPTAECFQLGFPSLKLITLTLKHSLKVCSELLNLFKPDFSKEIRNVGTEMVDLTFC